MRYLYSGAGWDIDSFVSVVKARHTDGRGSGLNSDAVRLAEERAAQLLGIAPRSVVMNCSGTAALMAIVCAITEQKGVGEAVIPAFGWASVAGVFRTLNWKVRGADVEENSLGPGLNEYLRAITDNTRVVVVTHMRGMPNQYLADIRRICDQRSLLLIEDCAQAWGVNLMGQMVGTFGDFSFFSTQENKLISTGEGGVCVSRDDKYASSIRRLSGYTIESDTMMLNLRMSDVQAELFLREIGDLERRIHMLKTLETLTRREFDPYVMSVFRERKLIGHYAGGNGQAVCVLPDGADDRELLCARLDKYQVRNYSPCGQNDPHQAIYWGYRGYSLSGLDSISEYIDIPMPLVLDSEEQDRYIRSVRSAILEVLDK